jgi:hypothetical protein
MWVDSSKWQAHTQEKTNEWLYTAGERKKEKFLDGDALYCLVCDKCGVTEESESFSLIYSLIAPATTYI